MANGGVKRWTPYLDSINQAINNTVHSFTNMKPSDVNRSNAAALFDYTEQKRNLYKRKYGTRLGLGDLVRIPIDPSRKNRLIEKGSVAKWTKELYQIVQIEKTQTVLRFYLRGPQGQQLNRRFYENELNLVLPLSEL